MNISEARQTLGLGAYDINTLREVRNKIMLIVHPDVLGNGMNENAVRRAQEINEAYEMLRSQLVNAMAVYEEPTSSQIKRRR